MALAQPALAVTLGDSIQKALATNPAIETAQSQQLFNQEEYKENRSGLFPVISTSATTGRIFGDNSTSRGLTVDRGTAYSWLGEGSAAVIQPLFDGKETFNRMDAAKARISASDYTIADTKENIALNAAQAHLAVLRAQDILDQTKAYYDTIQDYKNRIQLMVDEGVADETELAQAKNISIMLESTMTDYKGQLDAAYASYREVVGSMPQADLLKPDMALKIEEDVEKTIALAKNNHPLLLSGNQELQALTNEVEAEQSTLLPDLNGEVSYLKRDQREEIGGELTDARAVLKMNWDFETGGAQKARERQKKAQYLEALNKNKEIAREIESKIRQAYVEYETASKQKELVKKREITTNELFEAYNTQFEGARVRLLQLMQAENQLFNTKLEAISEEYRYLLSKINILASAGQLVENLDFLRSVEKDNKISAVSRLIETQSISKKDPNLFGDFGQVFIEDGLK